MEPLASQALFFDVDGTLVDLQERPDLVQVDEDLRTLLDRLWGATGGSVALVSGRALADLDRLFAPSLFPAAGQHGAEVRLASGMVRQADPEPGFMEALLADLRPWARQHPGLLLEEKGASLAVHFRLAPALEEEVKARLNEWIRCKGTGFSLQRGKMVLEVRPAWARKGQGLLALMESPPFTGRVPVFFGDDETDEDAFQTVRNLGGYSVKIGREPTCAEWFLEGPAALRSWLRRILALEPEVQVPSTLSGFKAEAP